jgi:hypothetical protein
VQFGSRVVLQIKSAQALPRLLAGHALSLSKTVVSNVFILQSSDALTAVREADRLAQSPEVLAAYPVVKRAGALDDLYALEPNDQYYYLQWYLGQHRGS